jgi:hypothetical protein
LQLLHFVFSLGCANTLFYQPIVLLSHNLKSITDKYYFSATGL